MCCRLVEMREKQVVCIKDGTILGYVSDIELDTSSGRLTYIIVYGQRRAFGLFGRDNDCRIPWENIQVIGEDSILVNFDSFQPAVKNHKGLMSNFFFNK